MGNLFLFGALITTLVEENNLRKRIQKVQEGDKMLLIDSECP